MMDGLFLPTGVVRQPNLIPIPEYAGLRFAVFHDGKLRWRCYGLETVNSVLTDAAILPDECWSFEPDTNHLDILVDPALLDAQEHVVEVVGLHAGQRARLSARWRSDYVCGLEPVAPGRIAGWIYDAALPMRTITLVAEFGDGGEILVDAARTWHDPDGTVRRAGFEMTWEGDPRRVAPDLVALRVDGTGLYPFGRLRIPRSGPAHDSDGCNGVATLAAGPCYRRLGAPRVAVIVVVDTVTTTTLTALRSVAAARNRIDAEIIVIDQSAADAGPESDVSTFACDAAFTYLRPPNRLCYAEAVNRVMQMRPDRDVVLLDVDSEVPSGWLDRLHRAAMLDPTVAIVMPLSNADGAVPTTDGNDRTALDGVSLSEINLLCGEINRERICDVVLPGGPCLYLRREALNEVGAFDVVGFSDRASGQAEFALRAIRKGWRTIGTAELFVRHLGIGAEGNTTAFVGRLESRYPGYRTLAAVAARKDSLRSLRNRLQVALWRRAERLIVIVTLGLPGGVARHVDRLTRDLEIAGCTVLCLQRTIRNRPEPVGVPKEEMPADDHSPYELNLYEPASGTAICYNAGTDALLADLFALRPELVHVHHLIDLPATVAHFLEHAGLPYVVTLHDYFYGCPRVTLLDEGGSCCEAPPVEHCAPCLAASGPHPALHPTFARIARSGEAWRARWGAFLAGAYQVMAPSGTAIRYARQLFPDIAVSLRPHSSGLAAPTSAAPVPAETVRIAVIGAIGPHKGVVMLHELVRHCARREPDLVFVLVGQSDRDEALVRYGNVEIAGYYQPAAVADAIAEARCRTALFLSIWPETYSFTLSEALRAGLTPVALDIGAIGERLRALGCGVLVPQHSRPESIVDAIHTAALRPAPTPASIDASYGDLFEDYYAPQPERPKQRSMVGAAAGISSDLWCGRRVTLSVFARAPLRRIVLHLWCYPRHPEQSVAVRLGDGTAIRSWLTTAETCPVAIHVADLHATCHDITATFDFTSPLDPPDRRRGAAKLASVIVEYEDGTSEALPLELADRAEAVPVSPWTHESLLSAPPRP